jgi:hypothetical protein
VLGHGHEADGEKQQHGSRAEIGDGGADPTDEDRQRRDARHDGERRRGRDDQECDAAGAQSVGLQVLMGRRCAAGWWWGSGHAFLC